LFIGIFFVRSISDPIIKLKNAAIKIGSGEFITKTGISSKDEIGVLSQTLIDMSTSLEQQNKDLNLEKEKTEESEKKYRELLETNPDGIVIVNSDGKIEIINRQIHEMTGYTTEELIGEPIEILVPKNFEHHKQKKERYIERPVSRQMGEGVKIFVRCKDGSEFPAEISLSPLETSKGVIISTIIRDITKRMQAENQIEEAYQNQRSLVARMENIREEERTKMSRNIHDDFGNAFTLQSLDIKWLKKKLSNQGKEITDKINSMISNATNNITLTREFASNLRPTVLDDFGLEAAIDWYCGEINKKTGLKYELLYDIPFELTENITTTLFRILQEAITNVIRHADAEGIVVKLGHADNHIIMEIKDSGEGIDESRITNMNNLGILGMSERAYQQDGNITITNHDDGGTQLTVSIPLGEKTQIVN
jgi:PAS domain S-box-containing protein